MSDYVYLKNLQGQQIKPVTDLAAINMTTTNGIGVSTVNGGTIGIIDGYIESAYYTEMADPAVGAANVSSAYVDGGTAVAILGAYTVASAVDTAAPSQQKVPSEKAVVDALNNVVVSGVSYYAGTGINIDQGHTVSVANVPQSSVAGLENTLTGINTAVAAKQDAISPGYRMSLDGTTLNQKRYFDIESPTSATITLQAGHAYKITATNSSKTLDSEQIPANQFGLEGHAEIFVAGTGLIKTTSNVVLAQALEPDAVNNCTVRFHDGKAIISVEDHIAGYIVTVNAGLGSGTLYDGIDGGNQYIAIDASLNGQTLPLNDVETPDTGEIHIVGNGYAETLISGGITINNSKTTVANLSMQNVAVNGGTMTLGDVFIPSGSTVAVNGGRLAVEKVTGAGSDSVIDLGGTNVIVSSGSAYASGCTFSGGIAANGGALKIQDANATLSGVTITDNTVSATGGGIELINADATLIDCLVSGNSAPNVSRGRDVYMRGTASLVISGGTIGTVAIGGGTMYVSGAVSLDLVISGVNASGAVIVSSGAILDLASSINPGGTGGIQVVGGTCTVNGNVIESGTYTSIDSNGSATV